MDGDVKTADVEIGTRVRRGHPPPSRAKRVRWLVIVGVLLALVLGGLYGFNSFRDHAIANFFANNKPPPAQIAAVKATSEVGAALRQRHRLARRGASGDDKPRGRRPGRRDQL